MKELRLKVIEAENGFLVYSQRHFGDFDSRGENLGKTWIARTPQEVANAVVAALEAKYDE